ncbi:MAG: hypothetical protein AMJ62_05545 [Myxococcales bacterium SG8_38]|nr:MAG: hypothetical protein AMJ62_05545 [Myxococcales bacterium SG8_38]
MREGLTSLLRDAKGAAFVEALVSLPVFAALLGATVAFNSMYGAKLEAKARARRLAWLQADSGECPARTCRSSACDAAEAEVHAGGLDDLEHINRNGMSLRSFVSRVRDYLIGTYTDGVGVAEAPMPSMSSSPTTVQRGVTTLLCNTTARHTESGETILQHACAAGLGTTEYAGEICR